MTASDFASGIAFKELKNVELYPSVGMKRPGEHLRVNFGQTPFVFDIDGIMAVYSLPFWMKLRYLF